VTELDHFAKWLSGLMHCSNDEWLSIVVVKMTEYWSIEEWLSTLLQWKMADTVAMIYDWAPFAWGMTKHYSSEKWLSTIGMKNDWVMSSGKWLSIVATKNDWGL
jgi:hypothetical protein